MCTIIYIGNTEGMHVVASMGSMACHCRWHATNHNVAVPVHCATLIPAAAMFFGSAVPTVFAQHTHHWCVGVVLRYLSGDVKLSVVSLEGGGKGSLF
jgi:hypothetical protein